MGIYNQKGRGRKSKLNQSQQEKVKEWVKSEQKTMNKVMAKIPKKWQIEVSKETIKSIIKKLNMKQKKLEIFWLPTYSSKENLIEILWKFMEYE